MKEKRKEENPIMKKTFKRMLINLIPLIIILIYLIGLYVLSIKLESETFSRIMQIVTMIFLATSIVIFEIAYKKDSGLLAIYGIEALAIAIHVLSIPYVTLAFMWEIKWICIITAIIIPLYYVFKVSVLYTIGRKEQLESLSDIDEIIKKDEPKKKVAKKKKK